MTRTIYVDEFLFKFTSEEDWVNHARDRFENAKIHTGHGAICIDSKGRICLFGMHFMQATRENTYPVRVYRVRPKDEL